MFRDEDGTLTEVPVTDGHCKMQWKCDWALRWAALDVDYEMSGKDLIDSVKLSSRICRLLDGMPPESFTYELFLDEQGQKISKSKGNGLTIEEWLRYGTRESLQLFLYREPRKAKRLHVDVIPRNVDDYEGFLDALSRARSRPSRCGNPLWHIHDGRPPVEDRLPAGLTFAMLLNLASVANASRAGGALGLHRPLRARHDAGAVAAAGGLVAHAIAYYRDFVAPTRQLSRASRRPGAGGAGGTARLARRRAVPRPTPRRSSTSSTRSASATASPTCATGSGPSTRSCSARARARASAPSSRSTARPRRAR